MFPHRLRKEGFITRPLDQSIRSCQCEVPIKNGNTPRGLEELRVKINCPGMGGDHCVCSEVLQGRIPFVRVQDNTKPG